MIERLQNHGLVQQQNAAASGVPGKARAGEFNQLLQERLNQQATPDVTFSKHAKTRAEERGIEITQSLIDQLKGGMIRAQAKGATNVIAMDSEKAFIINAVAFIGILTRCQQFLYGCGIAIRDGAEERRCCLVRFVIHSDGMLAHLACACNSKVCANSYYFRMFCLNCPEA